MPPPRWVVCGTFRAEVCCEHLEDAKQQVMDGLCQVGVTGITTAALASDLAWLASNATKSGPGSEAGHTGLSWDELEKYVRD